jgi:Trk K+ transport system NAD-binding subunit
MSLPLTRDPCLEAIARPALVGGHRIRVVEVLATGSNGGAQEHLYSLVTALDPKRYDVSVVALSAGSAVRKLITAGIPVVIGDARHKEVLDELRLGTARALVAATSDDLVNLSTALNARAVRPQLRVVVRLFDPEFALRVQHGFSIRFTRSVSHPAAPAFAAAAVGSEVVATVPVGDRRVILFARLRVPAGSMLEGRTAASLHAPGALRLLAVADPGADVARWEIPVDEVLDADEEVVVAATRAGLADLLRLADTPVLFP